MTAWITLYTSRRAEKLFFPVFIARVVHRCVLSRRGIWMARYIAGFYEEEDGRLRRGLIKGSFYAENDRFIVLL